MALIPRNYGREWEYNPQHSLTIVEELVILIHVSLRHIYEGNKWAPCNESVIDKLSPFEFTFFKDELWSTQSLV